LVGGQRQQDFSLITKEIEHCDFAHTVPRKFTQQTDP
jgi:hypothetical protein